jgi:septal ring factor EnvC (AmiA/AmiB activator)
MEPNLVMSIGSILGVLTMFYTLHKDSKKSSEEMADLKARVKHLETTQNKTDETLQSLLHAVNNINIRLAKFEEKIDKIDKSLSRLEEDFSYLKNEERHRRTSYSQPPREKVC